MESRLGCGFPKELGDKMKNICHVCGRNLQDSANEYYACLDHESFRFPAVPAVKKHSKTIEECIMKGISNVENKPQEKTLGRKSTRY